MMTTVPNGHIIPRVTEDSVNQNSSTAANRPATYERVLTAALSRAGCVNARTLVRRDFRAELADDVASLYRDASADDVRHFRYAGLKLNQRLIETLVMAYDVLEDALVAVHEDVVVAVQNSVITAT